MSDGWSDKFKERLALGGEVMFALDFVSPDLFKSDPLTLERFVLHSHAGTADANHIPHAIQSVSGAGQRVNVRSWTSSMGGLRVTLSGADVAQFVSKNIPRGMMVEFKVGFAGFAFDEFETCGLFSYRNMTGSRNQWVMDFDSVFTLLQAPDHVGRASKFYGEAGNDANVSSTWNIGDATLELDNTTNFLKDGTTGARGLVYCQPSAGNPFYLKFTSTTATALNVVNVNVIDTTRTSLSVGDRVFAVGYLFSVVPDVIKRLLFGGFGAGASSVVTMPATWHMNLNYDSHNFNFADFSQWHDKWLALSSFLGDFITAEPIENPYRGLEEFLSAFGAWLVIKEGALSWRFLQRVLPDPLGIHRTAEYTITDEDVVKEDTYQLFNPDAPVEYFAVRYPDGVYRDEGTQKTRPNAYAFESPSRRFVFNDDTRTSNQTLATTNMRDRLDPWYLRIPDRMSLTLKGWRFAELVPGDVVRLESEYIYDMINASDVTHSGTQYLVTAVDVGWNDFTTRVELSTPPNR